MDYTQLDQWIEEINGRVQLLNDAAGKYTAAPISNATRRVKRELIEHLIREAIQEEWPHLTTIQRQEIARASGLTRTSCDTIDETMAALRTFMESEAIRDLVYIPLPEAAYALLRRRGNYQEVCVEWALNRKGNRLSLTANRDSLGRVTDYSRQYLQALDQLICDVAEMPNKRWLQAWATQEGQLEKQASMEPITAVRGFKNGRMDITFDSPKIARRVHAELQLARLKHFMERRDKYPRRREPANEQAVRTGAARAAAELDGAVGPVGYGLLSYYGGTYTLTTHPCSEAEHQAICGAIRADGLTVTTERLDDETSTVTWPGQLHNSLYLVGEDADGHLVSVKGLVAAGFTCYRGRRPGGRAEQVTIHNQREALAWFMERDTQHELGWLMSRLAD